MENRKYKIGFEVHYHEVDPSERATPLTILHYLEDAAISHSESVGQGIERLKAQKQAWILNEWNLQMDRYPVLGEKVMIETWSAGFDRFYGTRDFLIIDKNDKVIGRATSVWIFYNTERKRPSRIPADFLEVYGIDLRRALNEPLSKCQLEEGDQKGENEQLFTVRRSDIDTNGHVNNANYLQWMLEVVPEDIYLNYHLAALEITYKKAVTYGSSILSKCVFPNQRVKTSVCRHAILEDNSFHHELATAKTVWTPQ
ncbi:acyl-[acyl-carrier-protein] thioesterase [Desulfosporosinus youngiae]|uniref:Acyl-ACP thioesterase n=1 Tax=Desulfosporosinus youngiae DSM 17734 TaxID=768710 RepID=H5Y1R7_9FIRM|nr:acyl-ACP thioesterase domain-containing protein [Desulfosporosinus youngiae]EHQ87820.1 acyl-ACP thioesterase [Desulfosporosinus youngiae DSM 17734]